MPRSTSRGCFVHAHTVARGFRRRNKCVNLGVVDLENTAEKVVSCELDGLFRHDANDVRGQASASSCDSHYTKSQHGVNSLLETDGARGAADSPVERRHAAFAVDDAQRVEETRKLSSFVHLQLCLGNIKGVDRGCACRRENRKAGVRIAPARHHGGSEDPPSQESRCDPHARERTNNSADRREQNVLPQREGCGCADALLVVSGRHSVERRRLRDCKAGRPRFHHAYTREAAREPWRPCVQVQGATPKS
jgi:hypothetical protein